jgi:hypothetical protein
VIKSWRVRWEWLVAIMGELRIACKILAEKPEKKITQKT